MGIKHLSTAEIGSYLDGELGADAREMLESHMGECGNCALALGRQQALKQVLHRGLQLEPSVDFVNRVRVELAQLEDEEPELSSLFREWGLSGLGVAVGVLLLAMTQVMGPSTPERELSIDAILFSGLSQNTRALARPGNPVDSILFHGI